MSRLQVESESGFTIIEAIVSIGIMGVISAAIFALVSMSYQTTSRNEMRIQGVAFAAEEVERLRALEFSDLATAVGTRTAFAGGSTYTITSSRAAVPGESATIDQLTLVTVTSSWDDHGTTRSYKIITIFTDVNQGV